MVQRLQYIVEKIKLAKRLGHAAPDPETRQALLALQVAVGLMLNFMLDRYEQLDRLERSDRNEIKNIQYQLKQLKLY